MIIRVQPWPPLNAARTKYEACFALGQSQVSRTSPARLGGTLEAHRTLRHLGHAIPSSCSLLYVLNSNNHQVRALEAALAERINEVASVERAGGEPNDRAKAAEDINKVSSIFFFF